jgi:glycosyltransferase involved in cell wall biosynthesis
MARTILYILTTSNVGGAQRYVRDLASHLDPARFRAVVCYGGSDIRFLSNRTLPYLLFINDWLALVSLVRLYRAERPHIIHLNNSKAGVLGALAAQVYKIFFVSSNVPRPRVVFTAHGWVFNPTNSYSFFVRFFYVCLHRFAALFQDCIITVSAHDYALALRYRIAPQSKLVTVHNGIDPSLSFLPPNEARDILLHALGRDDLPRKIPWIGSLGRLTHEKHFETFIDAAALLPDALFFIIGSGREYDFLIRRIRALHLENRFFIVPPTGTDAQYLRAFDVFTLPSIKEGLPYTLLEAMAGALPIVVSNAGGMPEVIHNEENGRVVPVRDVAALSDALRMLITDSDHARIYGHAARERLRAHLTLSQMIRDTEHVYSSSIEN